MLESIEPGIPVGTEVYFVRSTQSAEYYKATIEAAYARWTSRTYVYEINCPGFPYVIGFAHDSEIFTDLKKAQAEADQQKLINLLRERDSIAREISVATIRLEVTNMEIAKVNERRQETQS